MGNLDFYSLIAIDIIWAVSAVKQFKTQYFVLFLMMALDGPVSFLLNFVFYVPNTYLVSIVALYIAFLSFFDKKVIKTHWYFFLLTIFFLLLSYFVTSNWHNHLILQIVIIALLILAIIHEFNIHLHNKHISIPLAVIILFFAMDLVEIVCFLAYPYEEILGVSMVFRSVAAAMGIFFILYRADDDRMIFSYGKGNGAEAQ